MQPHVASYIRHGRTMSRRARIAHQNNEHPLTYWEKLFALDKETLKKFMVYAGIHHTGLRAMRTRFYRLPHLNNEKELRRIYRILNSVSPGKKKFISYITDYLK